MESKSLKLLSTDDDYDSGILTREFILTPHASSSIDVDSLNQVLRVDNEFVVEIPIVDDAVVSTDDVPRFWNC